MLVKPEYRRLVCEEEDLIVSFLGEEVKRVLIRRLTTDEGRVFDAITRNHLGYKGGNFQMVLTVGTQT